MNKMNKIKVIGVSYRRNEIEWSESGPYFEEFFPGSAMNDYGDRLGVDQNGNYYYSETMPGYKEWKEIHPSRPTYTVGRIETMDVFT